MIKKLFLLFIIFGSLKLNAQLFEAGMETVTGPAVTTFGGDLSKMVGFSEIEISDADLDTAFAQFDLSAPGWLKKLYPGIRIEVAEELSKKFNVTVSSARFFFRFKWIGGSFTVSTPRLTVPLESKKLSNQVRAIRLSLAGNAEELAEHLALVALADATRVDPFFSNRYDLEAYLHFKKLFMGDRVLLEWGRDNNSFLDFEATGGMRVTLDPSPIIDLGSVLFIRERLDSLMEGGILSPVENVTDEIAEAVQNVVFGKFRDPRIVPSLGWFARAELIANFGGAFSVVAGGEFSIHKHIAISGTNPMVSTYGFLGVRWNVFGKRKR